MTTQVGINGFGRIGRNTLRAALGRMDMQVVAINDLGDPEFLAHLLRYDSVHGRFAQTVEVQGDCLVIDGHSIQVTSERDPAKLPWQDVDVAMECTGLFTTRQKAAAHLDNGSSRVLVSAPCTDADYTVVFGVNDQGLTKDQEVISNASCTTNCLAPVARVLHELCGIQHGDMLTVHSYTGDQPTLDTMHGDLYRARAAAMSMIPTKTGAAQAIGLVMPELKGRLVGSAVRVPTPNVSMVNLTFTAERDTTVEAINEAITTASGSLPLDGVLGFTDEPLVSIDFNGNPLSSIFALDQTRVTDGRLVRVMSWYDNEWGFSNRMTDTAVAIGEFV